MGLPQRRIDRFFWPATEVVEDLLRCTSKSARGSKAAGLGFKGALPIKMDAVMLRRRTAQCLMVAAMCAFFDAGLGGWSSSPPNASDFYIVSVGFSDALPGWHHSILEVRPDGGDVLVRYIRVIPSSRYCGETTKIVATATRLPNTSLPMISDSVNLCAIDPPALSRTIRAFPQTQGMTVFAGDRYAIVAKCGPDTRVIRLPDDWKVDMARLKRKRPRIAAL
jgi:hypothetical protein